MGTSEYIFQTATQGKDHPHACGDKSAPANIIQKGVGSSPRVWGQVIEDIFIDLAHGIIPTRVGTSGIVALQADDLWDHPHACGDKLFGMPSCVKASGSSPRVWGQVNIFFKLLRRVRIIPTRVGTSYYPNLTKNLCRDHPHACGDKSPLQQTVIQKPGSSPRVWGQGREKHTPPQEMRIIPTRVGTRSDTLTSRFP